MGTKKHKAMEAGQETKEAEGSWSRAKELTIGGLALAVTIAICVLVIVHWDVVIKAQNYGYFGVFIISVLAGGISFIPIPGLLVVFTLGSVINPIIIGIISGLGEAVGSIGIYLTGYGGGGTIHHLNQKFYARFEDLIQRRGSLAVFFMSAIFNPLFYPFTAVVGLLRFGLTKFFFLCWSGKAIKNTVVASLGYFGLGSILRLFGIGV